MIKSFRLSYYILLFTVFSCGKSLPSLHNIDLQNWTKDKNACGGQRAGMVEAFKSQKDKLLGLSEAQIIEVLGRPDRNELYKRNQKFYYYFLQPSLQCPMPTADALQLTIRFSAMGIAQEVSIAT
jgi:hypothetical protein